MTARRAPAAFVPTLLRAAAALALAGGLAACSGGETPAGGPEGAAEAPAQASPAAPRAAAPSAEAQAAIREIDALVSAGQLDAALALAEDWARREPNVADLHFALGLVTRSKLSVSAAEPAFERALALQPRQSGWMLQIAQGHEEAGDEATAERYLRRALEVDPYAGEAAALLGRILLDRGEDEEALALLEPAQGSGDAEVFALMGRAQRALGRDDEAERNLRRALDLDPRNLEALQSLGQLLVRSGRTEEGEEVLARLQTYSTESDTLDFVESSSQVEGASAANYLALGEERRRQGDLPGAMQAYEQAAARDPASAEPHLGLATVALARGDAQALLLHAQDALQRDEASGMAQLFLGIGQLQAGQRGEAEAAFARSRELEPWQAVQWDLAARSYAQAGLMDDAAQAYGEAYALEPAHEALALRLGMAQYLAGDPEAARDVLSAAAEGAPDNGDLALGLAVALDRLDDPGTDAALTEAAARYARAGTAPQAAAERFRQYPGAGPVLDRFLAEAGGQP